MDSWSGPRCAKLRTIFWMACSWTPLNPAIPHILRLIGWKGKEYLLQHARSLIEMSTSFLEQVTDHLHLVAHSWWVHFPQTSWIHFIVMSQKGTNKRMAPLKFLERFRPYIAWRRYALGRTGNHEIIKCDRRLRTSKNTLVLMDLLWKHGYMDKSVGHLVWNCSKLHIFTH